jgi:hypothetical protein
VNELHNLPVVALPEDGLLAFEEQQVSEPAFEMLFVRIIFKPID